MSLLDQGLQVMLYGMGTVFVFLTVLVLATHTLSRLVQRFGPVATSADSAVGDDALLTRRKVAAVAAVHLHRQSET